MEPCHVSPLSLGIIPTHLAIRISFNSVTFSIFDPFAVFLVVKFAVAVAAEHYALFDLFQGFLELAGPGEAVDFFIFGLAYDVVEVEGCRVGFSANCAG